MSTVAVVESGGAVRVEGWIEGTWSTWSAVGNLTSRAGSTWSTWSAGEGSFSVYVALTNIPEGELLTGFAMRSDPNVVFG